MISSQLKEYFQEDFDKWFEINEFKGEIKKDDCLEEIYNLWVKSNGMAKYFWFTGSGEIVHENIKSNPKIVSMHCISLRSDALNKFRDMQLDKILN